MQTTFSTQPNREPFVFQRRNRMKHHFVNTSKVLLYGYTTLSDGAKITYQVIDGYDWEDKDSGDSKGYAYPAVQTLAAIRNLSRRTIERHIVELEQAKLLTRQQRRNLPSVLIIEDVSEEESQMYLRQVQQTGRPTSPPARKASRRPTSRTTSKSHAARGTTPVTNDKNVVSDERRGTTKTSFAYKDEKRRSEEQQQVVAQLTALRIGEHKALELVDRYPPEYLGAKTRLLQWKLDTTQRGQPIKDTAAWLVRAIEDDYTLPESLVIAPTKPRMKVFTFNEQEGVYTVIEELVEHSQGASSP